MSDHNNLENHSKATGMQPTPAHADLEQLTEMQLPAPLHPPSIEIASRMERALNTLDTIIHTSIIGEEEKAYLAAQEAEAAESQAEEQTEPAASSVEAEVPTPNTATEEVALSQFSPRELYERFTQFERAAYNRLTQEEEKTFKHIHEAITSSLEFIDRAKQGYQLVPHETDQHSRFLDCQGASYQMVVQAVLFLTSYVERHTDILNKRLARPFSPPAPAPEPEPQTVPVPKHQNIQHRERTIDTFMRKVVSRASGTAVAGTGAFLLGLKVLGLGVLKVVYFPIQWTIVKPLQALWKHALKPLLQKISVPPWLQRGASKAYNGVMNRTFRPLGRLAMKLFPSLGQVGEVVQGGFQYLKKRYETPTQIRTNGLCLRSVISTTQIWCHDPATDSPLPLKQFLKKYQDTGIKESDFFITKKVAPIGTRGVPPWDSAHCEYYVKPGSSNVFPLSAEHTVTRVSFFNKTGEKIELDEQVVIEEGLLGLVKIKVPASLAKDGVKTVVYQIEHRSSTATPPASLCEQLITPGLQQERYLSEERESYQQALELVSSISDRFEMMSDYEAHQGFIETTASFPKSYASASSSNSAVVLEGLRMGNRYFHARHLMNQMAVAGIPTILIEGVTEDSKQKQFKMHPPSIKPLAVLPGSFESLLPVLDSANMETQINQGILSWPEYFSILAEARNSDDPIAIHQTARELHYRLQEKKADMYLEDQRGPSFSLHAVVTKGLDAIASQFRRQQQRQSENTEHAIGAQIHDPELQDHTRQIARLAYYFQTEKVFSRCLEQGSLAEARWYMQHRPCQAGTFGEGFSKLPEEYHKLARWDILERFLDVTAQSLSESHFNMTEKKASMKWVTQQSAPASNVTNVLFHRDSVRDANRPLISTRKLLSFVSEDNMALLAPADRLTLVESLVHGQVFELRDHNKIGYHYDCRVTADNPVELFRPASPQEYGQKMLQAIRELRTAGVSVDQTALTNLCRSLTLQYKYFTQAHEAFPESGFQQLAGDIANAFSMLNNFPGKPYMFPVLALLDSNSTEVKETLQLMIETAPEGRLDFVSDGTITANGNQALSSLIADRLLSDFDLDKDYKELFEDIEQYGFTISLHQDADRLSQSLIPIVIKQLKSEKEFVINYPDSSNPASAIISHFGAISSACVARTVTEIVGRGGMHEDQVKALWPQKNERKVAQYLAKNISTGLSNGTQIMYLCHERYDKQELNPADIASLSKSLLGRDERIDIIIDHLQQHERVQLPLDEAFRTLADRFPDDYTNVVEALHQRTTGHRNHSVIDSIHRVYQRYLTESLSREELHYGHLWLAASMAYDKPRPQEAVRTEVDELDDLLEPLVEPSRFDEFKNRHPALIDAMQALTKASTDASRTEAMSPLSSPADRMRFSHKVSEDARIALCMSYLLSHTIEDTFNAPVLANLHALSSEYLGLVDAVSSGDKAIESTLWHTLFATRLHQGYPGHIKDVAKEAQQKVASMRRNMQQRYRTLYGKYILHESGSIRPQAHSGDFEEFSNYRPGDDTRTIDWKASGRLDRLVTRKFREEEERPQVLMIDLEWLTEGYDQWASVSEEDQHLRSKMYPQLERLFTILTLAYEEDVPLSLELRSRTLIKRYDNIAGSMKKHQAPGFLTDTFLGELARFLAKANAVYNEEQRILGSAGVEGMNVVGPGDDLQIPRQTRVIAGIHAKNLSKSSTMLKSLEGQQRFVQVLKRDSLHNDS